MTLPNFSRRRWSGVVSRPMDWIIPAIRPSSVCIPVSTTMARAFPETTDVPK